jgi:hypothetical protein
VQSQALVIENTIFAPSDMWPDPPGKQPTDGSEPILEADFFTSAEGVSLLSGAEDILPNAFDELEPGWVPDAEGVASDSVATLPEGDEFWEEADFRGAFEPGQMEHWALGWTSFPAN